MHIIRLSLNGASGDFCCHGKHLLHAKFPNKASLVPQVHWKQGRQAMTEMFTACKAGN
jgi:hypothetical protein